MRQMKLCFFVILCGFCLGSVGLSAQTNGWYNKQWEKVDAFMKDGLPRSADSIATIIHKKALAEKNIGEAAKGLIHQMKNRREFTEKQWGELYHSFKNELEVSWEPYTQILHSMMGRLISEYLELNYWRNNTVQTTSKDVSFETMSNKQLLDKLQWHIQQSLSNQSKVALVPLASVRQIVEADASTELIRPTLWDFLAHRAVVLFEQNQSKREPFGQKLEIDSSCFVDRKQFVAMQFLVADTSDFVYQGLKLWQEILKFRSLQKNQTAALVDADMERLLWLEDLYEKSDGEALLYKQLCLLENETKDLSVIANICYQKARVLLNMDKPVIDLVGVVSILNQGIKASPQSWGGLMCKKELSRIKQPSISLIAEKTYYPNREAMFYVEHKNCKALYWTIVPIDSKLGERDESEPKKVIELFKKSNYKLTERINIPQYADYQSHSVEVMFPSLKPGQYLMVVSDNPKIEDANNYFSSTKVYVTSLGVMVKNINAKEKLITVVDRISGRPIEGAKINLFLSLQWGNGAWEPYMVDQNFTTNKMGQLTVPFNLVQKLLWVEVLYKNDRCFTMGASSNDYHYANEDVKRDVLHIFTDRKVYRPGQTVYFKAIYTLSRHNEAETIVNSPVELTVRGVTGNEVQKIKLTTNEFGSCSGQFQIPVSGLNGQWSITSAHGTSSFAVEAYKRPKFIVDLIAPNYAYKAGDTIVIKGKATSYSGDAVAGADVKYSVVKQERWMPYYRGGWPMKREKNEVAIGELATNEQGDFEVRFLTSKPVKSEVDFYYQIEAVVTDLNGETQSTTFDLYIGIENYQFDVSLPTFVSIDKNHEIKANLQVTNFANQPLKGSGHYLVYRLTPSSGLKPTAHWGKPELSLVPENIAMQYQYIGAAEQYNHELVDSVAWSNSLSETLVLQGAYFEKTGKFKLVFKMNGCTTTIERFVTLIKSENGSDVYGEPLQLNITEKEGRPMVIVTSAFNNLFANVEIMADGEDVDNKVIELSDEQCVVALPVDKYGGQTIKARAWSVHQNRFYLIESQLYIPDTTKQLDVVLETFREKLTPGATETIKFKVNGSGSGVLPAELVATLYDASLDAIEANHWSMQLFGPKYFSLPELRISNFNAIYGYIFNGYPKTEIAVSPIVNDFKWFGLWDSNTMGVVRIRGMSSIAKNIAVDEEQSVAAESSVKLVGGMAMVDVREADEPTAKKQVVVQMRRNLNETAFFTPHLITDSLGNVSISYTVPESLTKWKLMALAHNNNGYTGQLVKFAQTAKQLMVVPEVPRFFREGDELVLKAKISNQTENNLAVSASIELLDAATMLPIKALVDDVLKRMEISANGKQVVGWQIKVPENVNALVLRVKAQNNRHGDGEEHLIPVLPKRVLVSESLPFIIHQKGKSTYRLRNLESSKNNKHQLLTLRYTQQASWEVFKALPYLLEFPHECSEQLLSRLYALSVGSYFVKNYPQVKQALTLWQLDNEQGGRALTSPLEANEGAMSIVLNETPWQQAGINETANRKRLVSFLDNNETNDQINRLLTRIEELQTADGSFVWFKGMGPDQYLTRHIMVVFGQMLQHELPYVSHKQIEKMIDKGFGALQNKIIETWEAVNSDSVEVQLTNDQVHLLYAMSFYANKPLKSDAKIALDGMLHVLQQHVNYHVAVQAMAAMVLHRYNLHNMVPHFMASLKEKAVGQGTSQVFYRSGTGWHWTNNGIETQALVLSCFNEILPGDKQIEAMQNWLVLQKRTQAWPTTRSTVLAIGGMMSSPHIFEASPVNDDLKLGRIKIAESLKKIDGLVTAQYTQKSIKPNMGKVTINKKSSGTSWGSLSWQYFTTIDKVEATQGDIALDKTLFVEKHTDQGTQLLPVKEADVKIGDKIVVRLTIHTKVNLEYVHLKDLRSSLLEPIGTLSGYHYAHNIGYYKTIADASASFFISSLSKGSHVIEYSLRITGKGITNNGFATLECMYAPEFEGRSGSELLNSNDK